jgi:hypothetical protein
MTSLADRQKHIADDDLMAIAEAICGAAPSPSSKTVSH